jgi:hypothetical protein
MIDLHWFLVNFVIWGVWRLYKAIRGKSAIELAEMLGPLLGRFQARVSDSRAAFKSG